MLFIEELGWDYGGTDLEIPIADRSFALKAIAHKRGMVAYQYTPAPDDAFPDHPTRQKIERTVTQTVREHIIIYVSHESNALYWQWVKREPGQTDRSRQHIYHQDQSGEALIQKLEQIAFSLDEEEDLTIADVASRIRAAFDVDKVTKKFYDHFKKEHTAFLDFITGIQNLADREWYASLMLNRMMFIYFIQKRGFLDNNLNYLRDRLERVRQQQGGGNFHSFYRLFLMRLFHEGLGQPEADRDPELAALLGKVPYLNGGLFDVHDLERDNPEIQIPDEAFQKIFDFFDAYDWYLDDRPLRNDNEINPDVLGYIFEKYINQKQMGAYYTKEDITGYISRNTIIPFLFDQAKKECAIAFKPDGAIWRLLSDDPDRYFYEAGRHGITYDIHEKENLAETRELPPEIAAGLNDVSKRDEWNKPAPSEYALPTETWREHIARRQRYEEIHAKLADGEVTTINDLITYNLDIEKFALNAIEGSEGPELIRAFYKAITRVSILDPTCGSGAFLFAALNILEPIYTACLESMEGFLDDLKRSTRQHSPNKLSDFTNVLKQVSEHASERYFILKSIIIDNLYGVDIMDEAVEICKLRLFLKLVAQLESYDQIEPLPDIDFNIRAGNTLVGFTSIEEVQEVLSTDLIKQTFSLPQIEERAEIADRAFRQFREMQTTHGMDADKYTSAKLELKERLDDLRDELDEYLAEDYGVKMDNEKAYIQWRNSHQPFHWFVEFYGIMNQGGFDVIIGNPPYVSARKVRQFYAVKNLTCDSCTDIYAWILERCQVLLRMSGRTGMIVPLSLSFSSAFDPCRRLLFSGYSNNWFSSFGRIPSALFNFNVRVRNTIHLALKSKNPASTLTTRLHRWFSATRPTLFQLLEYVPFQPEVWKHRIPKLNSIALANAFERLFSEQKRTLEVEISSRAREHILHFKKTAYNWLNYCRKMPPCYDDKGQLVPHTKFGQLYFENSETCQLAMLLANGKIMLAFWFVIGDDFDVTRQVFADFPVDLTHFPRELRFDLLKVVPCLEVAMEQATQFKLNAAKMVGNYNLAKCRKITDLSDKIFCEALGIEDVWEDIELYCTQTVRTNFHLDEEND